MDPKGLVVLVEEARLSTTGRSATRSARDTTSHLLYAVMHTAPTDSTSERASHLYR